MRLKSGKRPPVGHSVIRRTFVQHLLQARALENGGRGSETGHRTQQREALLSCWLPRGGVALPLPPPLVPMLCWPGCLPGTLRSVTSPSGKVPPWILANDSMSTARPSERLHVSQRRRRCGLFGATRLGPGCGPGSCALEQGFGETLLRPSGGFLGIFLLPLLILQSQGIQFSPTNLLK